MNQLNRNLIISLVLMLLVFSTACARKIVKVEIDYGEKKLSRTVETAWHPGITALEALKKEAKVETHEVDKHLFVTSIDSVAGERGAMGWYYEVNGEKAKKLAVSNTLDKEDHVKWSYQKDVCSPKFDAQHSKK